MGMGCVCGCVCGGGGGGGGGGGRKRGTESAGRQAVVFFISRVSAYVSACVRERELELQLELKNFISKDCTLGSVKNLSKN